MGHAPACGCGTSSQRQHQHLAHALPRHACIPVCMRAVVCRCGIEYDLDLWASLINTTSPKSLMVENCHWGFTLPNATWCVGGSLSGTTCF